MISQVALRLEQELAIEMQRQGLAADSVKTTVDRNDHSNGTTTYTARISITYDLERTFSGLAATTYPRQLAEEMVADFVGDVLGLDVRP